MKIGFSLSQCIGDIIEGNVALEDVMLVTSSTKFPDKESMIIQLGGYFRSTRREAAVAAATTLWDSGRIHQPRLITDGFKGIGQRGVVWMDIAPTTLVDSEAVKDAWETYKTLLTLTA